MYALVNGAVVIYVSVRVYRSVVLARGWSKCVVLCIEQGTT